MTDLPAPILNDLEAEHLRHRSAVRGLLERAHAAGVAAPPVSTLEYVWSGDYPINDPKPPNADGVAWYPYRADIAPGHTLHTSVWSHEEQEEERKEYAAGPWVGRPPYRPDWPPGKYQLHAWVTDAAGEIVVGRRKTWVQVPASATEPTPAPDPPSGDDGYERLTALQARDLLAAGEKHLRRKIIESPGRTYWHWGTKVYSVLDLIGSEGVTLDDLVIEGPPCFGGGAFIRAQHTKRCTIRNVRIRCTEPLGPGLGNRFQGLWDENNEDLTVDGLAMIGGGDRDTHETDESYYSYLVYKNGGRRCTYRNCVAIDGHGGVIKFGGKEAGANDGFEIRGVLGIGVAFGVTFSWTSPDTNRAIRGMSINGTVDGVIVAKADGNFTQPAMNDGVRVVWTHNCDRSVTIKNAALYDTVEQPGIMPVVAGDGSYTDGGGHADRRSERYLTDAQITELIDELMAHGFTRPARLPALLRGGA